MEGSLFLSCSDTTGVTTSLWSVARSLVGTTMYAMRVGVPCSSYIPAPTCACREQEASRRYAVRHQLGLCNSPRCARICSLVIGCLTADIAGGSAVPPERFRPALCTCRVLYGRTRYQPFECTWTHSQKQRAKRKRKVTCESLSGSPQNQDPEQEGPHTSSRPPAGEADSPDNDDRTESTAAEPQNVDWREFRCCESRSCTSCFDFSTALQHGASKNVLLPAILTALLCMSSATFAH